MKQPAKHIKNKLTHIIRLSKKNRYKNKFDLQKGNARKSWQLIKEVLKCKPKVTNPSTSFTLLDGSETSNPKVIANVFSADPQPPRKLFQYYATLRLTRLVVLTTLNHILCEK